MWYLIDDGSYRNLIFRFFKKEPLVLLENTSAVIRNETTQGPHFVVEGRSWLHDALHATGPDLLRNTTVRT